jgi:uncharacterized protein YjbJ (UPF0337 family)
VTGQFPVALAGNNSFKYIREQSRELRRMGVFEEAKGKAKEAVGDLTDNPDLQREGEAQKEKGEAQRQATEARGEAKAHEAKAKAHEVEQEAAEAAKK